MPEYSQIPPQTIATGEPISQWAATLKLQYRIQQEYVACTVAAPTSRQNGIRERDFKSAEADEDIDLIRQLATCLGPFGGSVLIASTLDHHPLCLPSKWIIYVE